MSVVTLTPAGAVDATYRLTRELEPGAFTRATSYTRELSGKGVNVTAALHAAAVDSVAVVVMGEDDLGLTASLGRGMLRPVTMAGPTRVNTSIIDHHGATTKVNAPASELDAALWEAAQQAALEEIDRLGADWFVISGTLPLCSGAPLDLTELISQARLLGARVAVDTSGAALRSAAGAGKDAAGPDSGATGVSLVAPNAEELAELSGRTLTTVGDAIDAARSLLGSSAEASADAPRATGSSGLELIYVSLGADGSLLVSREAVVLARARAERVVNTAGAGDASLAGLLAGPVAADAETLAAAAARAARFGAHAVAQASTLLPGLEGAPHAEVTPDPDPHIPLSEPVM